MNVQLLSTSTQVQVVNTRPEHAEAVAALMRRAYGFPEDFQSATFVRPQDLRQQLKRFPEGQFVALLGKQVVGMATTMLTDRSPYQKPLPWMEAIGDLGLRAHKPEGT